MTAAILCIGWALWFFLCLAGGQGFGSVTGLMSFPLIPKGIANFRPRWYMAPLLGFFAFEAVSALWSPRPFELFDVNWAKHQINLRSDYLRVGLALAAVAIIMAAAQGMDEKGKRRVALIATLALSAQMIFCVVAAISEPAELKALSAIMTTADDGLRNNSRNDIIMTMAAIFLALGLMELRRWRYPWALVIGAAVVLLEIGAGVLKDVEACLAGMLGIAAAILLVKLLPKYAFRLMGVGIAALLMASPALFSILTRGADIAKATSAQTWRLSIWQKTTQIIAVHPVRGGGIGVLRTVRDRIKAGEFTGQMIVPNHSHNMFLQLWAETGAIGAFLMSAAIVLAAWRLPHPSRMGASAASRAAGLIGAMTVICLVSFDLWNDWYWTVGGWLALLAMLSVRSGPKLETPAPAIEAQAA